jgi:hypothetical protein
LTQSEDLFQKYCSDSGIPCRAIEVTGVRTPDFEVELAGVKVICELKQLDPNEDDLQEHAKVMAGVSGGRLIPNRLRRLLKGISGQLKSASTAGHPTVMVVYDNTPFCSYLDDDDVRESMFGRWSITEFIDERTGASWVSPQYYGGNKGVGPSHNTSLSALAVLEAPASAEMRLRLFHNPHAKVPLDPRLLEGLACTQVVMPDGSPGDC